MISDVSINICHTDEEIREFVLKLYQDSDIVGENNDIDGLMKLIEAGEVVFSSRLNRQRDLLGCYIKDCLSDVLADNLESLGTDSLEIIQDSLIYLEAYTLYCAR